MSRVEWKPRDETSSGSRRLSPSFCWLDAECLRSHLVPPRLAPRPRRGAPRPRHRPADIQKAPGASWGLTVRCAFFISRCMFYVIYANNEGEVSKGLVLKLLCILVQAEHRHLIPGLSHTCPISMVFKDRCNFRHVSNLLMFCVFK